MRDEWKPWLVDICTVRDGKKVITIICEYRYLLLLPLQEAGLEARPKCIVPKRHAFHPDLDASLFVVD